MAGAGDMWKVWLVLHSFPGVFAGSEGMFGKFQDSVSIWRRVWTPPKAFGRFRRGSGARFEGFRQNCKYLEGLLWYGMPPPCWAYHLS